MSKSLIVAHAPGDLVYLLTDKEQHQRIVVRVNISPGGTEYALRLGDKDITWHVADEITKEAAQQKTPGFK